MELYINLYKAVLDFAKLVKKPVQVRGKNGKVFTRMQWVNPEKASTGHGVRMIRTKEGFKRALQDGIDKHPHFHETLRDQGVDPDTFEDHHPHFFLPETEESVKNRDKRQMELEEKHGYGAVIEDDDHAYTYAHGHEPPEHMHKIYDEHHFVGKGEEHEELDEEAFMHKYGIHPEIHRIILDEIHNNDRLEGMHPMDQLYEISKGIHKHWNTIKKHIENHIKSTVEDTFARNVQLGALRDGDMLHHLSAGAHPQIARATVNKILGEGLANKFRKDMENCNLSINFPEMHLDNIQEKGYFPSTLESFIEKKHGEKGVEKLNKILSDPDLEDPIDAIEELGEEFGYGVRERAMAEYKAIGLLPGDDKPVYMAFNPLNSKEGAAPYYGKRWLKITDVDNVLNHSTATFDDSFATSNSVPKIWNMEHLKDMFILKSISKHFDMDKIVEYGEEGYEPWHRYKGEIPIELHYHKGSLSPDQFEIVPDRTPIEEDHIDLDDLDDLELDDDLDWEDLFESERKK